MASVWPVAQGGCTNAREIKGWLLEAIVQIAADYTSPGHRVLLLAPPSRVGSAGRGEPTPFTSLPSGGLLAGLIEAAESVSRLDRTAEARSADLCAQAHAPGGERPAAPESVHGPALEPISSAPTGHRPADRRQTAVPVGPSRFDAVIALVDPHDPDWVSRITWSELLARSGVLAFITHSDCMQGRLADITSLLTHTAHRTGLTALDRVVLLEVPIRFGALATEAEADLSDSGTPAPHHVRVHSDLLLFTRPASAAETVDVLKARS
ncbi:hypothetical protein [Streptomyces sp. NBC_00079]|uniref:hypothetical protein n=1 Tax=Streptomyces sp. NBC_00079 TaxID=2975644 RepID=UPI00324B9B71